MPTIYARHFVSKFVFLDLLTADRDDTRALLQTPPSAYGNHQPAVSRMESPREDLPITARAKYLRAEKPAGLHYQPNPIVACALRLESKTFFSHRLSFFTAISWQTMRSDARASVRLEYARWHQGVHPLMRGSEVESTQS